MVDQGARKFFLTDDLNKMNIISEELKWLKDPMSHAEEEKLSHDVCKKMGDQTIEIKGYDFNKGVDYSQMFASYKSVGFQASYLSEAIDRVNDMIKWRLSDEPIKETDEETL